MFGATVLVPILTGLPISVALVASGVGTLIYIVSTKAQVPVYLGSSFAYIAAISIASNTYGVGAAYVGLMVVGLIYVIVAMIIKFTGKEWLETLLPPVVIGPMIAVIGLGLANVAIGQAGLASGSADAFFASLADNKLNALVAVVTFLATVMTALKAKGFFKVVPILTGILVGYVLALAVGLVDFTPVVEASFFAMPEFVFFGTYTFDTSAVLMFAPIAFVTIAEHIGDHTVLGQITDRDFIKNPGLDRTLIGDGVATFVSAMIGGPANTTYGENTGVVGMTRVASVYVTGGAAVIAIFLGFIGKFTALISTIPAPVMGGISILLFGLIAANGLKVLVKEHVDMTKMRNIIIVASMLIVGLGGANIAINDAVSITGMSFAAIVGIVLNLILPKE
jgi:uracil permease